MSRYYIKSVAILIALFCFSLLSAQSNNREIAGIVKDKQGEPIIGATIIAKNQPGLGASTNIDGAFKIKVGEYDILVISYIGHKSKEFPVVNIKGTLNVVLEEDERSLDEVVVTAGGTQQRKLTLSGAITNVDTKTMKVPTANISNALVGNVAGIIGRQTSGEPGSNNTEFWIRGISTFGANSSALVLVDGIERSLDQLNAEDIESFAVLKDASATAIYGSRGANGVILITTKRGSAGKVNINAKFETGYNTRSRTPKYADGVTYANMANEARMTRYQDPLYSDQEIAIINSGLDQDLYPNVDWASVVLKEGAPNARATLSLSGGGATARYYVSGSYYSEKGIYKTNSTLNKYNTNSTYERYNYRMNVDIDVTKSTLLRVGVGGYLINQNRPSMSTSDIWGSIANLTPITVPRMYSNGYIPTYGEGNTMNPEVQLTRTGYATSWENKVETNISLEQSLEMLTKGLKFIGTYSFDNYSSNKITRTKNPELWKADGRDATGDLILRRVKEASLMSQSTSSSGDRRYYLEAKMIYDRLVNKDHRLGGLLMYYQQETGTTAGADATNWKNLIPKRNMALSGRLTYGYKDRYLTDFNFGYTGSENFEKNKRFGFFPAVSGAWVISEEPFVKNNFKWLNLMKVRYSYGEVGNDQISNTRFPYISTVDKSNSYNWGEYGSNSIQGYRINNIGSANLTWERAKKNNLGFDVTIYDNKVSATVDIYRDHRTKIFMQRSQMPYSTGLQDLRPWANIGEMESKGVEGQMAYSDKIDKVSFTLRGNFTYAKTQVLDYDEAANALPYQMMKGYRYGQNRGLISLGLFKNQEDINNSPTQTFMSNYLPGDIKYKDVNGDGIIDSKDEVPIGTTTIPSLNYGMGLSLAWNNFDFNILFQGAGSSDFFIGGTRKSDDAASTDYYVYEGGNSIYPFQGSDVGNILKEVTDPNKRWISREISGSASTENSDAILPRLSYGGNANNYRYSTFWLRNAKYLRLKNLEIGYNLPKRFVKSFFAENARIAFVGYNLAVFSPFKWWDPEIGSHDGASYPISKTYSVNVSINF